VGKLPSCQSPRGRHDGITQASQAPPTMLMIYGRMQESHAALSRESSDMSSTTHRDDVMCDAHLVII
jgi:hypothetical protein